MSGGSSVELSALWGTGSRAIAAAVGLGVIFRFVRWLVEFVFKRLDVSRSHLGERLKHVEVELDAYREATMLMIGVVAKIDPDNAALERVAQILRTTAPRTKLDLDELVERLAELPGTKETRA